MKKRLLMIGVSFIFYIVILLGIAEYYQKQDSALIYGMAEGESGYYFLTQEYSGNGLEVKLLSMSEQKVIEERNTLSLNNTFRLTDFYCKEEICTVTGIEQLTGEIYVYSYDFSKKDGAFTKEIYAAYAGYVPIDAMYREEVLSVMDRAGNIYTEIPEITAEAFKNSVVQEEIPKEMINYQNRTFWVSIIAVTVGYIVAAMLCGIVIKRFFKDKSGVLSVITLTSLISFLMIAGIFILENNAYYKEYLEERREKSEFYAILQKAQYEESGAVDEWMQKLGEQEQILYQASIFKPKGGTSEVLRSSSHAAGSRVEWCCGTKALKLLILARMNNELISDMLMLNGVNYMATAIPVNQSSGQTILVTVSMMGFAEEIKEHQLQSGMLLLGCWAVFNMIAAVFLLSKTKVLSVLHRNLELLSEGSHNFADVQIPDNEFGDMYKLLSKISTDIESYRYADKMTRNYYERFIPNKLEQVFDRIRLKEVASGEQIQVKGTILNIQLQGATLEEHISRINNTLMVLDNHRETGTGVVLTGQSETGRIRVLYKQGKNAADEAVETGIEILSKVNGMLFLHFSKITCAMAGNEKTAIPYVRNEEVDWLSAYADWMEEKGACMIITDDLKQQLNGSYETRYIGYIQTKDKAGKLDLFEVLDAYDKDKRYYRNSTMELFENGLNLFYQNDFYFARNNFLEVLKKYPDDGIARWYVFACEEMFNAENIGEIRHDLFLGKEKGE